MADSDVPIVLSIDDLYDVLDAVMDTADEWHNFGLALGVLEPTLRHIKADHGNSDCKTCIREMLSHWLRNGQSTTWQDIIRALCSRFVGQRKIAEEIGRRLNCHNYKLIIISIKPFIIISLMQCMSVTMSPSSAELYDCTFMLLVLCSTTQRSHCASYSEAKNVQYIGGCITTD